jgi:hypothetical protein
MSETFDYYHHNHHRRRHHHHHRSLLHSSSVDPQKIAALIYQALLSLCSAENFLSYYCHFLISFASSLAASSLLLKVI